MPRILIRRTAIIPVLAGAFAAPAAAQPRITVGVGAGASSLPSSGADPRSGRYHSQLVVGVAPRAWPVELRGDVLWAHWPSYAGPVSVTANALVPVGALALGRAAVFRPYGIGGLGAYGVGSVGPRLGANIGAGARVEVGRAATFVEVRRHSAYARTFATAGVTLRP